MMQGFADLPQEWDRACFTFLRPMMSTATDVRSPQPCALIFARLIEREPVTAVWLISLFQG